MVAFIQFQQVCADFPIYDAKHRSIKQRFIQTATGGRLSTDDQGHVSIRALDHINFSIKRGERVGLLGHNGAGKTSLLKLITGSYEPTAGFVHRQGQINSLIDISLGIDLEATGRENIHVRGALLGLSKQQVKQAMQSIIDFSELGDFIDMPLRTYSTGMHLRLAFAVSSVIQPEILIMDEWLSVGDVGFQEKVAKRLSDLVQTSDILVLASHSKSLILKTCERVIWLEHGRIRMDGDAHTVTHAYFN